MKYKNYYVIVFLMSLCFNLQAQNVMHITLNNAVKMSLQASGNIKIAYAKVAEATAMWQQAKDNRLPDLKATGSYMKLNSPDVSLKIKLSSSGSSPAGAVKVNEAEYAIVNASVPLFSGFRIKYGIESAKYLEQAAKLDAENQKDDVIENTIDAYCNLYKAAKTVELVKRNLKQQEQRVTDFANLEKNGVLAYNDLLKTKLQQSNTELALLDAENNLKITCINMSLMLGLPENTILETDSLAFSNLTETGNVNDWEVLAFKNRKEIGTLGYQEKASESSIKSLKGEYFPGIALTGGYMAVNVPNLLTVTNAINAGLGLQYNFSSLWKTGAKIDAAKARLIQLQANQNIVADKIRLQVNLAYQNYLLALQKIDVYKKAVEQSKENYRISKNKYNSNLITITELLDADVLELQAELNFTFSKVDAFNAYKKLLQATGTINEIKN